MNKPFFNFQEITLKKENTDLIVSLRIYESVCIMMIIQMGNLMTLTIKDFIKMLIKKT